MRKKILLFISVILTLTIILFREMIAYGIDQALGQLEIIKDSRPIAIVMEDPEVADSLKQKIALIQEVRDFAFNELGLEQSDNYTTFYDQKGQTILWNLSASASYSFEAYKWSFPILGSFPYKGFFDLEKAKEEYEYLKDQGYDVRIRPVGGWSTLGWTTDPILSNMLKRNNGSLAELIIHELTHSTLFVKDDIVFNENLAAFIGERGAIDFMKIKYGEESAELIEYIKSEDDSKNFRSHMLQSAQLLDSLYQNFNEEMNDSLKSFKKHLIIDQVISSVDTLDFYDPRYYKIFSKSRPNNAYFMSYLRYYSSEDSLKTILSNEYQYDLKGFILGMKTFHEN